MNKYIWERLTAILFCIMIFFVFIYHLLSVIKIAYSNISGPIELRQTITSFETSYNNLLSSEHTWIDIYGLTHRILLKHEVGNLDVIKDKQGNLYQLTEKVNEEETKTYYNSLKTIYNLSQKKNIPFLFLQTPYKNFSGVHELEIYAHDNTYDNYDSFLQFVKADNIPYLDLRKSDKQPEFYKTDHHWTVESSLNATIETVNVLNSKYNLNLDSKNTIRDLNDYERLTYKNSFLGSSGIRVGKYYTGKDDFTLLIPKFDTNITYKHYINGEKAIEKSGDFWNAFIDQSILGDSDYYNKYNACLNGGYVENIIINNRSENNMKALFVSHSYGRPMIQYLSLFFYETRYLDPQEGRYNGNYLEYINEFNPDVIIVMYNGMINVGN